MADEQGQVEAHNAALEMLLDEARSMFDIHIAWASDQCLAKDRALRAAQALATACMAPACYSHEELADLARATKPTFDAALKTTARATDHAGRRE